MSEIQFLPFNEEFLLLYGDEGWRMCVDGDVRGTIVNVSGFITFMPVDGEPMGSDEVKALSEFCEWQQDVQSASNEWASNDD